VSGRGVGMDVVRTRIERIGGTVDVESRLGEGTTVRVKIPLTLAIIPALIVSAAGDRYAIPQVSLLELVRTDGKDGQAIEMIHDAPVYRLRGKLLPLVYLDRELQDSPGEESRRDGKVNIVVLQAGHRQFGLVVDAIHDTVEIVVKPLGKELTRIPFFAGATIMGDGRVALILDVVGVAQHARVISEVEDRGLGDDLEDGERAAAMQALLLFQVGQRNRMAIPLTKVSRLEEFRASQIERAGSQAVVQYRDQLLPLVHIANLLGY
ncbi:MAG: chemotaxis protein CheW, partial [Planctomycetales bacterium]